MIGLTVGLLISGIFPIFAPIVAVTFIIYGIATRKEIGSFQARSVAMISAGVLLIGIVIAVQLFLIPTRFEGHSTHGTLDVTPMSGTPSSR